MVNLPFIYAIVKSKQARNERPTFMISVTMYTDAEGKERSKRDIYFSCSTAEARDRWMIAIEFLKAKATIDQYQKNNGLLHTAL